MSLLKTVTEFIMEVVVVKAVRVVMGETAMAVAMELPAAGTAMFFDQEITGLHVSVVAMILF